MNTRTEGGRLQGARGAGLAVGLACALLAAGCGQADDAASNAAGSPPRPAGYGPPPELLSVAPLTGGRFELSGSGPPAVAIRLATPDGAADFATTDADGRWRLQIAPSAAPRFFGLSMSKGGRVVQAMGYLFLAPDGSAARLRAGGGSELLGARGEGLAALTVDYDNQRAATLAGRAAPGESVSVRVDGVERGQASADQRGRFVIPLNQPLAAGAHDFDLVGASTEVEAPVTIGAARPLTTTPFAAARSGPGWRIDWLTPGGGEQTTLMLADPGPAG